MIAWLTNGLSVKNVSIDNQTVEYFEAGQGDPLVFIRGFVLSREKEPVNPD